MKPERLDDLLGTWLRTGAERPVPADLDHQVRTLLRTLPLPDRRFSSPLVALGLAVSATLALTVGLALPFASAGGAEAGVGLAATVVTGYLAVSSVIALPLLARRRREQPKVTP